MNINLNENYLFREHVNNNEFNLDELYTPKIITLFNQNPVLMEQILVSNNLLYEEIKKSIANNLESKKENKLINTLSQYYLRSISRNTPFGLFSSSYDNRQLSDDYSGIKKSVLVSFRWFSDYVKELALKRPETFKFKFVDYLTNGEDRYIVHFKNGKETTIIASNLIKLLVDETKDSPLNFNEIVEKIHDSYNDVEVNFIEKYLLNLIMEELLIPETGVLLSNKTKENFENLCNLTQNLSMHKETKLLENVIALISEYEYLPLGDGIDIYFKIKSTLNELHTTKKNDLSIIGYGKPENSQSEALSADDAQALTEIINFLHDISYVTDELKDFKYDFVEKFGEDAEIPLLDVLDSNFGIGFPEYKVDLKPDADKYLNTAKELLTQAIINDEPLVLDENSLKNLMGNNDPSFNTNEFPFSGDIILEVEPSKIGNKNMYTFGGVYGTYDMVQIRGRFREFDDEILPENRFNNVKSVDINALPLSKDYMGIIDNKRYFDKELSIDLPMDINKEQIHLSDLVIGLDDINDVIYCKNVYTNELLQFRDLNILNNELKSPVVRFLLSLNQQHINWWYNNPFFNLINSMNVFPEVIYKNIRLNKKTWRMEAHIESDIYNEADFQSWYINMLNTMKKLHFPKYVLAGNLDEKLVLEIENVSSAKALYKHLIKEGSDTFYINEIDRKNLQKDARNASYEIVCTFSSENFSKDDLVLSNNRKPVYNHDLLTNPLTLADGWLYLELEFGNEENLDIFCSDYFNNWFEKYEEQSDIQFFIRYTATNQKPTIRYRIKSMDNIFAVLSDLICEVQQLMKNGIIKDYSILPYYREMYRYGLENNIDVMERVFSLESGFIISNMKLTELDKTYLLLNLMYQVVTALNLNLKDVIDVMEKIFDLNPKNYLKEKQWLQENKTNNNNLVSEWMNNSLPTINNQSIHHLDQFYDRYYELGELDLDVLNMNQIINLVCGSWHMSYNRMFGINRKLESGLTFEFYKLLQSLLIRSTNKGGA
ncbi:thiopeptide-type bacteriocin biosynthesis protein [Weissella uvarum]|uniref:thiopeptide-type bacteriocin biosynthesis protein n=1 Tax=Weissella uvarum TaxID=1479233 RepID=UPI00195F344A|nr:thiopeptide-type bacteriocin biosynthesis protein [Weissella uvarum]MBM7617388.1 thiopeptide-type bacteriocin biosynthesis protein [Weissella uvarum]MCM0595727.1 thiopeptide-type bacteriocin biosynthesis protein [Weissella uvarum]